MPAKIHSPWGLEEVDGERRRRSEGRACEDGLREQSHSGRAETLSLVLHRPGQAGDLPRDLIVTSGCAAGELPSEHLSEKTILP